MIIYLGYKLLEFLAYITPYSISYLLAIVAGKLTYLLGFYVPTLKKNVSNVLDINIRDKRTGEIVQRLYYNWFRNVADFIKHPLVKGDNFRRRIELEGVENLDNALKDGKGVVIFTAHIGNFEWGASRLGIDGYKIWGTALSRPYKKTNLFFENRRLSKGVRTIYVDKTMLEIFRLLRRNEIVAIPSDLDPGGTGHVYDFFGKKAHLPTGAVELSLKSGAPLIPSFIWRKDKYNHFQIIGKPVELVREGKMKDKIRINKMKVIKIMEKYIKEHIEEWEMFHDIWIDKDDVIST
jgi:KDO2-lipid IV(A) lauroyltransferase